MGEAAVSCHEVPTIYKNWGVKRGCHKISEMRGGRGGMRGCRELPENSRIKEREEAAVSCPEVPEIGRNAGKERGCR